METIHGFPEQFTSFWALLFNVFYPFSQDKIYSISHIVVKPIYWNLNTLLAWFGCPWIFWANFNLCPLIMSKTKPKTNQVSIGITTLVMGFNSHIFASKLTMKTTLVALKTCKIKGTAIWPIFELVKETNDVIKEIRANARSWG